MSLRQEYNDNLLFSTTGEERSFITSIAPAIDLSSRSERLEARLSARLEGLLYEGKSAMNSLDQAYDGGVNYRLTPMLKIGTEASFARQSRPDRSIETAGLVDVIKDSRQFYALSGECLWSEKTVGSVAYSFEQIDYDNRRDLSSQSHAATLGLVHDLSLYFPGLKGKGNLGFNRDVFSAATVDGYSATVGASYALHELWSVTADVGARYTVAQFTPQEMETGEVASSDAGWVASVALAYRGELLSGNLSFLRNVTVASGLGGAAERTAVVLDLSRRISYELSAGGTAGYYLNTSGTGEFSAQPIDEATLRINPFVRYEFSRDLALEASYQYTRISYNLSDQAAAQNLFMIRLVAGWQLLE